MLATIPPHSLDRRTPVCRKRRKSRSSWTACPPDVEAPCLVAACRPSPRPGMFFYCSSTATAMSAPRGPVSRAALHGNHLVRTVRFVCGSAPPSATSISRRIRSRQPRHGSLEALVEICWWTRKLTDSRLQNEPGRRSGRHVNTEPGDVAERAIAPRIAGVGTGDEGRSGGSRREAELAIAANGPGLTGTDAPIAGRRSTRRRRFRFAGTPRRTCRRRSGTCWHGRTRGIRRSRRSSGPMRPWWRRGSWVRRMPGTMRCAMSCAGPERR